MIHPKGVRLLWQYVQLIELASLTGAGLTDHCERLDSSPGIRVRWLDVGTVDMDLKSHVRQFNVTHFGQPR